MMIPRLEPVAIRGFATLISFLIFSLIALQLLTGCFSQSIWAMSSPPEELVENQVLSSQDTPSESAVGKTDANLPATDDRSGGARKSKASLPPAVLQSQIPSSSIFQPPPVNACMSNYDQFYESEPGVYAYWSLCESGSPIQSYDYVGQFDLTKASQSWGKGTVSGGAPGPVPDGETAASVSTATMFIENQGIPLNTNGGTVSVWVKASTSAHPVSAVFFAAVTGKSGISISINATSGKPRGPSAPVCFNGSFTNSAGTVYTTHACGYAADVWHRVALTWSADVLTIYLDGVPAAFTGYTGHLDNLIFYYRLFPGCCDNGQQMTLAKALVANSAWSPAQVSEDFRAALPKVPRAGVYVSSTQRGTIHRDVLGYADYSQDISTQNRVSALIAGVRSAGFTTLRYSGGRGLKMDLEDWHNPVSCPQGFSGSAVAAPSGTSMSNTIDTYLPQVAQPTGLDVVYTVNYGTNPPVCNGGGDPVVNAANLVRYANQTRHYAIKHWEIGNEIYATNSTDFHPNPNTGASYVNYEPAFYTAMKAQEPDIKIGVPIGGNSYPYQMGFDLPVIGQAKYDAIVWHNYPMKDPISDGNTIYQDRVASNMNRTHGNLLKLQTELLNNHMPPDAIWVTEWDSAVFGGKWSRQTMGAVMPMYTATQIAEYMVAGVQLATWWTQGGVEVCSTFNYDSSAESAYSWVDCGMSAPIYTGAMPGFGEVFVGLKPGDLTPAARAIQLLSESGLVTEGEHMVYTQADVQNAPWLECYGATHGASYAVILINRDRDGSHTVPISIAGLTSGQSAQQWTYGRVEYDNAKLGNWSVGPRVVSYGPWADEFNALLPPWSVNVIVFKKRGAE
jgi:hypothetical protein